MNLLKWKLCLRTQDTFIFCYERHSIVCVLSFPFEPCTFWFWAFAAFLSCILFSSCKNWNLIHRWSNALQFSLKPIWVLCVFNDFKQSELFRLSISYPQFNVCPIDSISHTQTNQTKSIQWIEPITELFVHFFRSDKLIVTKCSW